jgi:hypothetical protein
MENVLDVYTRPHDPIRPLVCLDETSKEKRAKVGDALRGGISWRCRVAVNSLLRK